MTGLVQNRARFCVKDHLELFTEATPSRTPSLNRSPQETFLPDLRLPHMSFKQRGTSFIELLVVIAITAIVAAASIPSFAPTPHRQIVRLESKKLFIRIRESMSIAREFGELPEITLSNSSYAIASRGRVVHYSLPASFLLESTVPTIRFFPSGAVSPSRVTIEADGYVCHVIISLRGRLTRRCAI